MCHLGSSLQTLGFTVSLDLWSQAELGALGPVPWLHSRLDQLKRQGGKVVLVLTQAAWIRAEEWGARGWERNTTSKKNKDTEEDEAGKSYPNSSSLTCVDVFSASLSCILADYLQGRAGERFTLVQFESLPPQPPGGVWPLPELFRGLHLYSLPSQSLGFLTELAGARQMATPSARRKRAGGLRMASRALASGLSNFTEGTTVLRLAGVSQSCVGVGAEDSGETVPLQTCLLTPPSSPDTSSKVNEMEWLWKHELQFGDNLPVMTWKNSSDILGRAQNNHCQFSPLTVAGPNIWAVAAVKKQFHVFGETVSCFSRERNETFKPHTTYKRVKIYKTSKLSKLPKWSKNVSPVNHWVHLAYLFHILQDTYCI